MILEPKKRKSVISSTFSTSVCHEVMGLVAMIFVFLNVEFQASFFNLLFYPFYYACYHSIIHILLLHILSKERVILASYHLFQILLLCLPLRPIHIWYQETFNPLFLTSWNSIPGSVMATDLETRVNCL